MKQISVYLENKPGELAEATHLLAEAGINMRALSLADTLTFGILRIIVDEPDRAAKLFETNGYAFKTTEVVAVNMEDKPGALSEIMKVCADEGLNVEYAYAFLSAEPGQACFIIRPDDKDKAEKALIQKGFTLKK